MSMWLLLAKVEVGLLEAVRAEPELLANLFSDVFSDDSADDRNSIPDAAFDAEADRFEADYRTLSAIAEVMPSREWFEKATEGTEELDFDEFTYGSAVALDPKDVSEVAAGLVAEGWYAGNVATTPSDEPEDPSEDDDDDDDDLASFFITAAAQGRAIVGGIN